MLQKTRKSVPWPYSEISLLKLYKTSESLQMISLLVNCPRTTPWLIQKQQPELGGVWTELTLYVYFQVSYAEISHLRCDLALSWDASGAMPRAGGLRWVMEMHTVLHEPLVSWDTQKYTNLHVSTPQTIPTWLKPLLEGGIVDTVRQRNLFLLPGPGMSLFLSLQACQSMSVAKIQHKQAGHQMHSHTSLQAVASPSKYAFVNTIFSLENRQSYL